MDRARLASIIDVCTANEPRPTNGRPEYRAKRLTGRVIFQASINRWFWLALAGAALVGCAHSWTNWTTLPNSETFVRDQLVIHSDFPVASQHRLIEEIALRRNDLKERLDLPLSDEPIHIYLFENEERFEKYLKLYHPLFPSRRAFFLETDTRLMVYAHWGDRVADDLRHEVTHGYLHAVVQHVPLWLDEGLAEYFEVARGARGLNRPHVRLLSDRQVRQRWQPSLERLEALEPTVDMTQEDYAEAWAWVHWMMETPLEACSILPGYLDDLRRNGSAEPISARVRRVEPQPEQALIEHVRQLAASMRGSPD